jgi:hypothetical protein
MGRRRGEGFRPRVVCELHDYPAFQFCSLVSAMSYRRCNSSKTWWQAALLAFALATFSPLAIGQTMGSPQVVGDPTFNESVSPIDMAAEADSQRVHLYNEVRILALGLGFIAGCVFFNRIRFV